MKLLTGLCISLFFVPQTLYSGSLDCDDWISEKFATVEFVQSLQ